MKKDNFESLQRALGEVAELRAGFVVHEPVDVRQVRARTKLTRARFAETFGLDTRTVEQWEQGRRTPFPPPPVQLACQCAGLPPKQYDLSYTIQIGY